MSFAVWPSARICLAVAMSLAFETFRGRPHLVPLAREIARFEAVRAMTPSRSPGVVSKHSGPALAGRPGIRSAHVAESDFLVSQASPTFRRSDTG